MKKKLRQKTNLDVCKENDIQYSFLTNVVEETSAINKIRATMEIISKTLCGTLGPYGSTTLVQDRAMNHLISKDGYDLCNRITFQDETARTVLDVVRTISSNQVSAVGDGSTSAIIVANALLSVLTDKKNRKKFERITSKDITSLLNDIREFLEENLKQYATPISEDMHELATIAKIATNNDDETGKFIYDLYKKIGKFGFISTEVSKPVLKDTFTIKDGINWARGPIDDCFYANATTDKKIIYETPLVFISNSAFTYDDLKELMVPLLGTACGTRKKQLLIIAESFDQDVINFFRYNRTQHLTLQNRKAAELDFTAVDIDTVTKTGKYTVEDISYLCGCEVFDKFKHIGDDFVLNPDRFLGSCEKVIMEEKSSQIIGSYGLSEDDIKRKEKAVEEIRAALQELNEKENLTLEEETDLYFLKKRLSQLTATTAVIYVGGKTQTERMSRERLIDDAVFACKSALKYGYITGGNIMIPRILVREKKELLHILMKKYSHIERAESILSDFIDCVKDAFIESYRNVLENSYLKTKEVQKIINYCIQNDYFYNLKTHKLESDDETEVINSLDTDIQILKSTVSIIGILGVSNQVITLNLSAMDQRR